MSTKLAKPDRPTGPAHRTGPDRRRTCHVLKIPQDHPQRVVWKDLRTAIAVTSHHTTGAQTTCETRFYISSHMPRAKLLAQAIRRHWSIENSQHGVLDVTFGEDQRRQQDRNGAANLAAVRRLASSLLRQKTNNKRGTKNKRLQCALDPTYLLKVLNTAKSRCTGPGLRPRHPTELNPRPDRDPNLLNARRIRCVPKTPRTLRYFQQMNFSIDLVDESGGSCQLHHHANTAMIDRLNSL